MPLWGVNHTVTMYAPIGEDFKGSGGSFWRFLATWGRRGGVWGTIGAEGHPAAESEGRHSEQTGELRPYAGGVDVIGFRAGHGSVRVLAR